MVAKQNMDPFPTVIKTRVQCSNYSFTVPGGKLSLQSL